jgi:tetratricopeptide (TPR) repeat protein
MSGNILRSALLALVGQLALAWQLGAAEPTSFPQPARDRYEQALELQKKGQLKEAIQAYEEAIRLGMEAYPRAHLYRAKSFLELQQFETAIAQYSKFIDKFTLEDSCRY